MKKSMLCLAIIVLFGLSGCNKPEKPKNDQDNIENIAYDQYLFGKVVSAVGNEIEIALVKEDVNEEAPKEEKEEDKGSTDIKDSMPAMTLAPATGKEDHGENVEFTGEKVTITIPAGIEILVNGKEGNLTSIQQGKMVGIFVDNKENLNVGSVNVIG